ncbi:hypothetical protein [Limosilactobacillus mucosae]|uniref:hypothetical protein n=1 Tax=Limosilactobacillus mucosae TaxID=97478 RepID=UPI0022E25318|nr:hypothetical protein [Limosilactobacillus mucosae]
MTRATAILFPIFSLLEGIQAFTSWLDNISVDIIIGFFAIIIITYIVSIIAYSFKLQQTIKRLSDNNNGLVNQHKIDLADKERLIDKLDLNHKIIELLINTIPSEKITETTKRIKLVQEVYNIGTRNENSKDN